MKYHFTVFLLRTDYGYLALTSFLPKLCIARLAAQHGHGRQTGV